MGPDSASFRRQPRAVPRPARTESELLGQLRDLVARLQEHIETRAEEKAGPVIEATAESARQMVARAEAEAQRWKDCNTELGRRLEVRDRRIAADDEAWAAVREYRQRLAAALGRRASTPWLSLVADIEKRLKEDKD